MNQSQQSGSGKRPKRRSGPSQKAEEIQADGGSLPGRPPSQQSADNAFTTRDSRAPSPSSMTPATATAAPSSALPSLDASTAVIPPPGRVETAPTLPPPLSSIGPSFIPSPRGALPLLSVHQILPSSTMGCRDIPIPGSRHIETGSKAPPDLRDCQHKGLRGYALPDLSADKFAIYFWEYPIPESFLDLSESRKAWKRDADMEEQRLYVNDGADDWKELSGGGNGHCGCNNRFELERIIASVLRNRAKVAFWTGKSWEEFEAQELAVNTRAAAAQAAIPLSAWKQWRLVHDVVDDGLRLAVFEALKERLCEEIWLKRYPQRRLIVRLGIPTVSTLGNGSSSQVQPPAQMNGRYREDSAGPGPAPPPIQGAPMATMSIAQSNSVGQGNSYAQPTATSSSAVSTAQTHSSSQSEPPEGMRGWIRGSQKR